MLISHQNLVDKVKQVKLVGWFEIYVGRKEEVEETVQSQEASQEKG